LNKKLKNTFLLVFVFFSVTSCSLKKGLEEDEKLLFSNKVNINSTPYVSSSEIESNIKQVPNRKLFFLFPFRLWIYNLYNTEKLEARNEKKKQKIEQKNQKREAKGKEPKEYKPVLGYRLRNNLGEAPVIYDSNATALSVKQINLYLEKSGFYHAEINTEIKHLGKNRIRQIYNIKTGKPTLISDFQFKFEDYAMFKVYQSKSTSEKRSLIRKNTPIQIDVLEEERSKISSFMRNNGYFYFSPDYVYFEVDTTVGPYSCQVKEIIQKDYEVYQKEDGSDTLNFKNHERYTIGKIYVNASYDTRYETSPFDTIQAYGLIFQNMAQLRYNPKTLAKNIFIRSGTYYSQKIQDYTYRRLSALKNFKYVNIRFQESDSANVLDCYINLSPSLPQTIAVEGVGTNTGGNLGVSGNLSYTHKNIFKGTELLNIKLKGGVESQPTNNTDESNVINIADLELFNTIEYGVEASLNIPELLFPKNIETIKLPGYNNPKTIFNLSYNFQQRPDYRRSVINGSFAYQWNADTKNTNFYVFQPVHASLINIDKSEAFQDRLDEINNAFYTSTYSDHLIIGSKLTYTWSNQNQNDASDNFLFNRAQIETAGNSITGLFDLTNREQVDGHYEIDSIQYAQYIKLDNDLRWYTNVNRNSKVVYRGYAGIGIPYGNLNVMPFDRSFYAGGSNDIRAWQARSLGPGSLPDSLKNGIDQVGNIILELNIEYRYKITKTVEGALFVDIGNIWSSYEDEERPGADFDLETFYRELAVGPGLGLRFDFSFLLLRLDLGFQVHDPAQAIGERWIFEPKTLYKEANGRNYNLKTTFNLGIDYPF